MRKFLSITRYEFGMYIRRPGYWIAYILLTAFYLFTVFAKSPDPADNIVLPSEMWLRAGNWVFTFNIFMPLLAGILTADRMQRDFRGSLRELQVSSPLSNASYILEKFLGSLAGGLLPIFVLVLSIGIIMPLMGIAPAGFIGPLMLAFLSIVVPAHAFVTAFSLACPLIIPLRVYQVLFTGYWFWGNLLSPRAFPTISDTVLNAVGQYPLQAYFIVLTDSTHPISGGYTVPEALLNLLTLTGCIVLVLLAANWFLRRQAKRA